MDQLQTIPVLVTAPQADMPEPQFQIKMIPVNSAACKAIGYDRHSEFFYVMYAPGKVYRYHTVSVVIACDIIFSDSVGQKVNEHLVRNTNRQCEKVSNSLYAFIIADPFRDKDNDIQDTQAVTVH